MALKARDTLACLAAARCHANVSDERALARRAFASVGRRWRVALHLEWRVAPRPHSGLTSAADIKTALKKLLKGIDPHPVLADMSNPRGPWSVTSGAPPGR